MLLLLLLLFYRRGFDQCNSSPPGYCSWDGTPAFLATLVHAPPSLSFSSIALPAVQHRHQSINRTNLNPVLHAAAHSQPTHVAAQMQRRRCHGHSHAMNPTSSSPSNPSALSTHSLPLPPLLPESKPKSNPIQQATYTHLPYLSVISLPHPNPSPSKLTPKTRNALSTAPPTTKHATPASRQTLNLAPCPLPPPFPLLPA